MNHRIKKISTSKIKPYKNNAKKHPESQVQAIAQSITEFGFGVPMQVDKNMVIISGHGRWLAAQVLELAELPCIVRTDLTAKQIKAYRLADNKVAESDTDIDIMLAEYSGTDHFTGYTDEEIEMLRMGRETGETDPNEEWEGMPEFNQEDTKFRSIIVHFPNQKSVDEFNELMGDRITNQSKYIWFPEMKRADLKSKTMEAGG